MNVFLDSNIWLRLFVDDSTEKYTQCSRLFTLIEQGKATPYTSTIVLMEVGYVLRSFYKISKDRTMEYIESMLGTRGLVVIEKTNFRRAFEVHKTTHVKISDCLIATQMDTGMPLCTYDQEFRKISGVSVAKPEEVIRELRK